MLRVSLLMVLILILSPLHADEEMEFLEEDIEFDATEIIQKTSSNTSQLLNKSNRLSVGYQLGSNVEKKLKIRAHQLNLRYRWDKLLTNSLFAKVDAKLIALGPNDASLSEGKNAELDWRVNNMSVQWSHQQIATTVGFQSIVLGELDTLPLNDLLTPWDYSQQAFTNPEDARVGQVAIDAQWFLKPNSSMRFIFVPAPDVNRYPAAGLTQLFALADDISISETFPYDDKAWEAVIAAKRSFKSMDVNIIAGRLHTNDPVLIFISDDRINADYPAFETAGLSINYNRENFLWKLEGNFQNSLPLSGETLDHSDKIAIGAGFDYDANGLYQLTFETSYSKLLDPPALSLGLSSSTQQSALRISKNIMNELINLVYFVSYDWRYSDQIHSTYASYKITDRWQVSASLSLFHIPDDDSPMRIADGWDQFTLTVVNDF